MRYSREIRAARALLGWLQEDLAKAARIATSMLSSASPVSTT